jgi:MFS transporter, PAT family, beta-lactamase induction signal transducer AmpG
MSAAASSSASVGRRRQRAPPYTFSLLHLCTSWPVGIVTLVIGNRLTALGVPVNKTAAMIAAAYFAFSLEFVWAPLVDSTLTRRHWFAGGVLLMCLSLATLVMAPWTIAGMLLLEGLAFVACSGAAIADAAIKGVMAYEVRPAQLGAASSYYAAGGYFAKAIGAAATLWMLAHVASRPLVGLATAGIAALAGTAIWLTPATMPVPLRAFPTAFRTTLADVWRFLRTRRGVIIALLCLLPFASGIEAGLIGAIASEWRVTPDELGAWIALSAVGTISGAMLAGWLSLRIGPWKTYLLLGWAMIAAVVVLALAPRVPVAFLVLEFVYRGLSGGGYAAILALVMTTIGKGAASTKASILWSLFNFAAVLPTMLEGRVHDHVGTTAMLLTGAALCVAGIGILLVVMRLLAFRFDAPGAASASIARTSA